MLRRRSSSKSSAKQFSHLVATEHDGQEYYVDKIAGVSYVKRDEAVRAAGEPEFMQVGTWSSVTGVIDSRVGTGSGTKIDMQDFTNPLMELETDVAPINSKVVYDEVPEDHKAKSGYQGVDPEWLDSQHKILCDFPWFRDKGTINAWSAHQQLKDGVPGQFLVRVVEGKEMRNIPSKFHAGRPGNYAISVKMMVAPKKYQVNHLLILPSWDPERLAPGETLYRIGTKNTKLFTSVPQLIEYYCHKAFHKIPGKGKKKKKFRLVDISKTAGMSGYADVLSSSRPGYLDVTAAGEQSKEGYSEVAPSVLSSQEPVQLGYADLPISSRESQGSLLSGYSLVTPGTPLSADYVHVSSVDSEEKTSGYAQVEVPTPTSGEFVHVSDGGLESEFEHDDYSSDSDSDGQAIV